MSRVENEPTAEWWARFVRNAEKMGLSMEKNKLSLAEREAIFERQWGPSIAVLMEWHGGEYDWLLNIARRSRGRVSPELRRELEQARIEAATREGQPEPRAEPARAEPRRRPIGERQS